MDPVRERETSFVEARNTIGSQKNRNKNVRKCLRMDGSGDVNIHNDTVLVGIGHRHRGVMLTQRRITIGLG